MLDKNALGTAIALLSLLAVSGATAVPPMTSYQGKLTDSTGQPVSDGIYSMRFYLWQGETGGTTPLWQEPAAGTRPVQVTGGLFNVILGSVVPLPSTAFEGSTWLETEVNGTTLAPRVQIVSVGYAMRAQIAEDVPDNTLTGAKIVDGTIELADLAGSGATPGQIIKRSEGGNAWIPADDSTGQDWSLGGNRGTNPGSQYLGTGDNAALELKVNGARAFRLEPGTRSPNVIGGSSNNVADAGVVGAVICGGGDRDGPPNPYNRVTDHFGFVGGGIGNTSGDTDGTQKVKCTTVCGGCYNWAKHEYTTVGGGRYNQAINMGATVPGGESNTATGRYSFAAGLMAKADHDGAFVWADSTATEFHSTANDQFLIRAAGGVGIGTSSPTHTLDVSGDAGVAGDVIVSSGDLVVTGSNAEYRGALGPNTGAPFPRPAYDSGWQSINPGQALELTHNVGGDVNDYVIDLQFRNDNPPADAWGIHNYAIGGDSETTELPESTRGCFYRLLTTSIIQVFRYCEDDRADKVRVRIWRTK